MKELSLSKISTALLKRTNETLEDWENAILARIEDQEK